MDMFKPVRRLNRIARHNPGAARSGLPQAPSKPVRADMGGAGMGAPAMSSDRGGGSPPGAGAAVRSLLARRIFGADSQPLVTIPVKARR
jgi:hypothetical protein